jgi:predicted nucleotidyltransferase
LAIPEDIKDIVIKFSIEAKKEFDVDKVLLFGSYASNNARVESDIDVAVILNNEHSDNLFEISSKLWNIASKIDNRIEPKLFFSDDLDPNEPASIFSSIMRTGIEVKIN